MGLFAVGLELQEQQCLVVGGGPVGQRKVESLLEAGARVTVISPTLTPDLESLVASGRLTWLPREYRSGDVAGFLLVISATDDEAINGLVAAEARERGLFVNVVDRPELCSFIVPAVARQGDLTIAVLTGGRSPMLARRIREELQATYGPEYARLLTFLGDLRPEVAARVPDLDRRREIYEAIVYSDALELVRQGRMQELAARVEALIADE